MIFWLFYIFLQVANRRKRTRWTRRMLACEKILLIVSLDLSVARDLIVHEGGFMGYKISNLPSNFLTRRRASSSSDWQSASCRWRCRFFFLSRARGRNIYYLRPLQPFRNDGSVVLVWVDAAPASGGASFFVSCRTACRDLLSDSVTRAEGEGFLQLSAWPPACLHALLPPPHQLIGHWSLPAATLCPREG